MKKLRQINRHQIRDFTIARLKAVAGAVAILLIIIGAITGYVIYQAPLFANLIATKAYVHSVVPGDYEFSQVAYPVPYTGKDFKLVGGQGGGLSCSLPSLVEDFVFERGSFTVRDYRRGADGLVPPPRKGARNGIDSPGRLFTIEMKDDSISTKMRQACVFHDYCYRHGAATYGYSQSDCDLLLLEHAYRLCRHTDLNPSHGLCVRKARLITLGVRLAGDTSFKRADRDPRKKGQDHILDVRLPFERDNCPPRDANQFDDNCTSTYFEFDPFPTRAEQYAVYRIADAPRSWVDDGVHPKALYKFTIKHTGIRLYIEGWHRETAEKKCALLLLTGEYGHLNSAPQISRELGEDGTMTDWFVWHNRQTLKNTVGYLSLLQPALADLADWEELFPGTRTVGTRSCEPFANPEKKEPVDTEPDLLETASAGPIEPAPEPAIPAKAASLKIYIGSGESRRDDPLALEIHAAPGLEPQSGLRLLAMRPDTCISASGQKTNGQPLCYVDIVLDVGAEPPGTGPDPDFVRNFQEPRSIRDSYNRPYTHAGGYSKRRGDSLKYRNRVLPPYSFGRDSGGPIFGWLIRGTYYDIDHGTSALLRRAQNQGSGSKSAGIVRLEDFFENHEPAVAVSRLDKVPKLLSISKTVLPDKQDGLQILQWPLPEVFEQPKIDFSKCRAHTKKRERKGGPQLLQCAYEDEVALRSILRSQDLVRCFQHNNYRSMNSNCVAKRSDPLEYAGEQCDLSAMDAGWLIRPPAVVSVPKSGSGEESAAVVLFTKLRYLKKLSETQSAENVVLDVQPVQLNDDGTCRFLPAVERTLNFKFPRTGTDDSGSDFVKWNAVHPSRFLSILRSTPTLWEDVDKNGLLDAVLPFSGSWYVPAPGASANFKDTLVFHDLIGG